MLSATGTAAVINMQYIAELGLADSTGNLAATKMTTSLDRTDFERSGGGGAGVAATVGNNSGTGTNDNKGSNNATKGAADGDSLNG